jgi:hypothetical protein
MNRLFFPLILITLGVAGIAGQDAINAQWVAMYPHEPARQLALSHCTTEDSWFNRFSASARAACYKKYLVAPEAWP